MLKISSFSLSSFLLFGVGNQRMDKPWKRNFKKEELRFELVGLLPLVGSPAVVELPDASEFIERDVASFWDEVDDNSEMEVGLSANLFEGVSVCGEVDDNSEMGVELSANLFEGVSVWDDDNSEMGVKLSANLFEGAPFGDGIIPPVPYRD